jgi:glycosyltransferase involved in cell wall biosynthesis
VTRIAFLAWRDTTHPDGGGSEVFVEEVARRLVARGHTVTLVCARHPGSRRRDEVGGVRVVRVGGRLTVYPRGLWWLVRHRRRVDVVVDVVNGLPFGRRLVRRRGVVGLVHHVHQRQWQIIYPGLAGRIGWFVERRFVPLLYRRRPVVTVSEASRRDLERLGLDHDRITVVRNGVDHVPSGAARSELPRLCLLARLVPHKQIDHAFAVVARLREEFPGLVLDVVGEGWWRAELEADLARLGLGSDAVVLHGHLGDRERDDVLARAWAMLLPSAKEGWGLAVIEAAVQGTPTVGYRSSGGLTESVRDGETGVLVDGLDGLVAATRSLLADPARCRALGAAARDYAAALTWQATADQLETVLESSVESGVEPSVSSGRRR